MPGKCPSLTQVILEKSLPPELQNYLEVGDSSRFFWDWLELL
jgi:hypothetical protein